MKNAKRSTIVVGFIIIGISAILISNALGQRSGRPRDGGTSESELEKPPVPADDNEKKILSILADIITLIEGDAHEEVKKLKDPIDILFLDADKEGYIDYLNKLLPLVRPGGLVIAHNINTRMADPKYMKAISTDPKLETIVRSGISLTLKK